MSQDIYPIQAVIAMLSIEIEQLTVMIKKIIAEDPILKAKQPVLKSIPEIGDIVAFELLVLLPELGHLNCPAMTFSK